MLIIEWNLYDNKQVIKNIYNKKNVLSKHLNFLFHIYLLGTICNTLRYALRYPLRPIQNVQNVEFTTELIMLILEVHSKAINEIMHSRADYRRIANCWEAVEFLFLLDIANTPAACYYMFRSGINWALSWNSHGYTFFNNRQENDYSYKIYTKIKTLDFCSIYLSTAPENLISKYLYDIFKRNPNNFN